MKFRSMPSLKAPASCLGSAKCAFIFAAAVTSLLSGPQAHAQTKVWTTGGNSNWFNGGNWVGSVAPVAGDIVSLGGAQVVNSVNNLTPDISIGGLLFTNSHLSSTNAFTVTNNRLTLGGNITTTASTTAITDTMSIAMILSGNRTVTTGLGHNLTLSGILSETGGSFGITKADAGTLTLTGANSYTGATTINAGTLNLGNSTANGSLASTVLNLGGGTLSYTRTGSTTQAFTTTNLNAGPASAVSVVSGNILNLGTIVNAGGTINFGSTGAGTVAALTASNTNGIISGATFNGTTWAVANGAGIAITGLTFVGSDTTTTNGTTAANYTNKNIDVTNSAGTLGGLITANSLRFNTAAANTVTLAAGTNTLASNGILVTSTVGNNLSTITGGDLTTATANNTLNVFQNNGSNGLTISSKIINNGTTGFAKSGTGTLTLSGNNSYTGTTTLSAGTLILGGTNASTTYNVNAGTLRLEIASGATSVGQIATGAVVNVASGAALNLNAPGGDFSTNAAVLNNFALNLNGGSLTTSAQNRSNITLPGAITLTGANTVSFSQIRATLGIGGAIGGTGGITFSGGGLGASHFVRLTAQSNYGGATGITSGSGGITLLLSTGADRLPTSTTLTITGSATTGNFAQLNLGGQNQTLAGLVSGGTAEQVGVVNTGGGTPTLTINNSVNNTFAGALGRTGSVSSENPALVNGSSFALTKTGIGTLTLSGANEYTGGTTVSAGTLTMGSAGALGSTSGSLTVNTGGTLDMGSQNLTVGNLTGTGGTISGTTGTRTLTIGQGDGTGGNYQGQINNGAGGTSALTKTGNGTITLSGTNGYTGATAINAGTLRINGNQTSANGAVTVASTATLGGSGTIGGAVTVNAGGFHAAGNSIGTQTMLAGFTQNGTEQVELGTPGATPAAGLSDRTVVTGALNLGGSSTLQLINNAGADGNGSMGAGAYRLITFTGTRTGTFNTITNPLNATLHEKVVYNGSSNGTVDLEVYRLATGSTSAVNLGKSRVGDTLSGSLTTTNTATADGFSERLNASVGTNTGDVNASSGTVSGVIAGANASTISVGLNTGTRGAKSGTVTVSSVSDGTGTSGYSTTANGSQTVNVTGNVYDLATAAFAQTAGVAITGSGPSFTLDFGTGLSLNTLYTASFNIQNGVVVSSFIDTLTGDYSLTGAPQFGATAGDFSGLAAGAAANLFNITFLTTSAGSYSGSFTFDGTSVQSGLSDQSVGDFTIGLTAAAIPEPSSLLLGGLGVLCLLRRRRN